MQNEIIHTYLKFKKKSLLSYADTLSKVFVVKDENLWKDDNEFNQIIGGILDIYINKYYFRSKKELALMNTNNMKDKEFKLTLSLAMISDYYKDDYKNLKNKYKKSIYNLTLIVYIITNIDKEITFYKDNSVTIKNIVKKINKMYGDIFKNLDLSENTFLADILANKIKDVERKELRFFELLKGNDYYNEFIEYDKDIYFVHFSYELNKLETFKTIDTDYVYEKFKFEDKYLPISYELALITLLKSFVNDTVIPTLLLPVTSKYLSKKKNIEFIKKLFSNPYLKEYVQFSITYDDYKDNYKIFDVLSDLKFDIVLFLGDKEVILNYSRIKFDYILYVTEEFVLNNPRFNNFIETGNVKYKVIDKVNKYILEDNLININIKEEN